MKTEQTSCNRCGSCCNAGGPALHSSDLPLIQDGKIPLSALITLRKGELAHKPMADGVTPTKVELVKLKGSGREWNCCYFDQKEKSCTIYAHRPQACRVLKCWEPDEILQMVEKDTLTRLDILEEDDQLRTFIIEHDRLCPCPDLEKISSSAPEISDKQKRELQQLVRDDLRFRTRVVREFKLKVSEELFYFGRPVFQLLQPLGARVTESPMGIELHWKKE